MSVNNTILKKTLVITQFYNKYKYINITTKINKNE